MDSKILWEESDWSVKGKLSGSGSNLATPKLPYSIVDPAPTGQNGDTDDAKDTNLLKLNNNLGVPTNVVNTEGKQDTAYVLRWPSVTLGNNQVAHFASNIGATVSGYALPTVRKTYTNLTSSDGNNVGDTLKFTLTVRNDGYNSHWNITKIIDNLPAGLTLVPGSVQDSSWISGNNINFDPQLALADNSEQVYTFQAKINNQAPYNLSEGNLINRASFTGHNDSLNDSKTYMDSVKIPVNMPKFNYRFTKLVRNDTTNSGGSFSSKVDATKGDTVEYRVILNSNGSSTLTGANFSDTLPAGLELEPNSVTLNGASESSLNFPVGSLANNVNNTILFKAKVTGINASTASNTAYLNNVTTSGSK